MIKFSVEEVLGLLKRLGTHHSRGEVISNYDKVIENYKATKSKKLSIFMTYIL